MKGKMVFLRGLAASVLMFSIHSHSEVGMAAQEFITVSYHERRPTSTAEISWQRPSTVTVTVTLPRVDQDESREERWEGAPLEGNRAQAAIGRCRPLTLGERPDFDLQATSDGKSTHVTWSSDAETEELRQLRQSLEEVGHLAFVKAKAYAARGHTLVHAGAVTPGIDAFRTGLNSLADRYFDPQRVDDTGMKLVLAEQNRKGGKLDVAATLYERVLNDRLSIYAAHKLSTDKLGTPRS